MVRAAYANLVPKGSSGSGVPESPRLPWVPAWERLALADSFAMRRECYQRANFDGKPTDGKPTKGGSKDIMSDNASYVKLRRAPGEPRNRQPSDHRKSCRALAT